MCGGPIEARSVKNNTRKRADDLLQCTELLHAAASMCTRAAATSGRTFH